MRGWSVLGLAVGVNAGLLLSAVVVCESWIFSLSLLATVRGSTSFLCPKRQRNEAKKALLNHATLSVHSVQFLFIGAPKARCSPEPRMCETLLLANPDMNTLRPQRSRASTIAKEPARPHASSLRHGLAGWRRSLRRRLRGLRSDAYLKLPSFLIACVACTLFSPTMALRISMRLVSMRVINMIRSAY
jgi:hypothetical protein